jgi:hypothetical protein
MKLRGGEFSTGTMGNFQPELTCDRSEKRNDLIALIGPDCRARAGEVIYNLPLDAAG